MRNSWKRLKTRFELGDERTGETEARLTASMQSEEQKEEWRKMNGASDKNGTPVSTSIYA